MARHTLERYLKAALIASGATVCPRHVADAYGISEADYVWGHQLSDLAKAFGERQPTLDPGGKACRFNLIRPGFSAASGELLYTPLAELASSFHRGGGRCKRKLLDRPRLWEKSHELKDAQWLDLESIARVQLTSEDPSFPIENALDTNPERNELGWRAADTEAQTIALIFTVPTYLRRIFLHFIEVETERSQEFVLRCSSAKETNPRHCAPAMDPSAHPDQPRRSKTMLSTWKV